MECLKNIILLFLIFLFYILGNHESSTMNQMYGFDGEVKSKYTAQMADLFTEVYNWLPLAHCLNKRVLVSTICFFLIINSSTFLLLVVGWRIYIY